MAGFLIGAPVKTVRSRFARALLRAARPDPECSRISLEQLIENLGERSISWSLLLFAAVNLMPLPLGSNVITAVPVILITAQMMLGYHYVHLPDFITRHRIDRRSFRRLVIRVSPAIGMLERLSRRRHEVLFAPRYYRLIGAALLAFSIALFMPIPLSGFIPAGALFISALGLIARDGLALLVGLLVGAISIGITIAVAGTLIIGAEAIS